MSFSCGDYNAIDLIASQGPGLLTKAIDGPPFIKDLEIYDWNFL